MEMSDALLPGMADPTPAVKAKTRVQKVVWTLTYCPAGTYITPDMLKDEGGILADECHSTSDNAMSFTYIHLTKRCRQSSIERFMSKIHKTHGIVSNEIFGYESIGSKSYGGGTASLQEHVVIQMLLKHCKENNPAFSPSTDGEPILKRGLLFEMKDPANRSKHQLVQYVTVLEERLVEAKKKEDERRVMLASIEPVKHSTRTVLLRYRREKKLRHDMKKIITLEKRLNQDETSDRSGEIYAAWNPVMTSLYKMGFTFKDAATRVRALQTAGVLEPFVLVRHAVVPDAR